MVHLAARHSLRSRGTPLTSVLAILAAFGSVSRFTAAQPPASTDEPLTAIDVLLLPNQAMIDAAERDNARLRTDHPTGFSLDATHRPHITLLQRYVRTADLPNVYAAVRGVLQRQHPIGWQLEATGYYYLDFNNMALAGIVVRPTQDLRELQAEIVAAVAPYSQPDGTAAAYISSPTAPGVNQPTLDYVNGFVPQRTGENFNPHVTIGVASIPYVKQLQSKPFPAFRFQISGAAVYHLGNFGTASKELWRWRPVNAVE
jgi:2'-5' RNA ligase